MKKLFMTGMALLFLSLSLRANDDPSAHQLPEDTLRAEFHDDHIDLSDGRELAVVKNKLPHVGSQVVVMAPSGASVTIQYEDGKDPFVAKVPFVYKVPIARSQENFRLVVNEGGPAKTWQLELQHESGISLEISSGD